MITLRTSLIGLKPATQLEEHRKVELGLTTHAPLVSAEMRGQLIGLKDRIEAVQSVTSAWADAWRFSGLLVLLTRAA